MRTTSDVRSTRLDASRPSDAGSTESVPANDGSPTLTGAWPLHGRARSDAAARAHLEPFACPRCGALQRLPTPPGRGVVFDCVRCGLPLERAVGRSATAALACAAAGLLLLMPACALPYLGTSIFGVSRQSGLVSSASTMFERGYADLGIVVWLLVVALPIARLGLVTAVLAALRLGRRPRWLGPAFRAADALEVWAMADVFLVGSVVAYERLRATISVEIGLGFWCYAAAALLSLLVRATLDKPAVWDAIRARTPVQDRHAVPVPKSGAGQAVARASEPWLTCGRCDWLCTADHEGRRCPRCGATLYRRRPGAVERTTALTLAAALLYLPANLYPIATLPIGLTSVRYTVLEGVIDLFDARLYGLGALVFTASFAIPLLKLGVIAWCVASVWRRSRAHRVAKTRFFGIVDEIGRWSMIDPFVIGAFVPVTQYNELVHGRVEPAAPAFAAVVLLTMFATHAFDPRLLWDEPRQDGRAA